MKLRLICDKANVENLKSRIQAHLRRTTPTQTPLVGPGKEKPRAVAGPLHSYGLVESKRTLLFAIIDYRLPNAPTKFNFGPLLDKNPGPEPGATVPLIQSESQAWVATIELRRVRSSSIGSAGGVVCLACQSFSTVVLLQE